MTDFIIRPDFRSRPHAVSDEGPSLSFLIGAVDGSAEGLITHLRAVVLLDRIGGGELDRQCALKAVERLQGYLGELERVLGGPNDGAAA